MKNLKCPTDRIDRSRRIFLGLAAVGGMAAARGMRSPSLAFAAAPKESGLSFEGLLKDQPGFQPREPAPLPYEAVAGFLSRDQMKRNYAAYRASFDDLLAVEAALRTASRDAAQAHEYASARARQMRAANDVLLHEFYFRNITPNPGPPPRYVLANMTEHMGALADWREDFVACARVARTWATLVYDPYDDRWHNAAMGDADAGGWAGANPLVVCDVADHAWSPDYKNRDEYVARFMDHIDWNAVAARYHAVDRH
jgi:Fe-Mn family superoxide dismutase